MKAPTTYPEASTWDYTWMDDAARAIYRAWSCEPSPESRDWWVRRYFQHPCRPLHPVVDKFRKEWKPLDWQQLLLEWPYVSETDPTKLAYTPNETYGQADRQLVTSIGKYLNKHWPHVPDHIRRDAVAAYTFDELFFVHTREEIIQGIELGPRSCMQSGYGSIPFTSSDKMRMDAWFENPENDPPRWEHHPYAVYAPEYGWSMAIRKKDGLILGRALCLKHKDTNVFVRSYCRRSDEVHSSSSDQVMEQWLQALGYEKRSYWPNGARLARLDHPSGYGVLAPYIDGASDHRLLSDKGDHLVFDSCDGHLLCDNTNGTADDEGPQAEYHCEDCGAAICEDDDRTWVGRGEDNVVCDNCADNYTHVRGSARQGGYREYYVHNNSAGEMHNCSYSIDTENVPEDVVQLDNGDYAERDDCICIDGEYYLEDDDDVVELANEWDGNHYALRDDTWECVGSEKRYHEDDDDDQIEIDGDYYHRDYLSELVGLGYFLHEARRLCLARRAERERAAAAVAVAA